METVIKQQTKRKNNNKLYYSCKNHSSDTIDNRLKDNDIDNTKRLKLLQQAISQNPYKATYHKQYAELLQSHYFSIKNNKYISAEHKKELDLQSLKHYEIYKTIKMVDDAFVKNKLNRKSILYIYTLKNYLNHYEQEGNNFISYHQYKIDNEMLGYSRQKEYSTRLEIINKSNLNKEQKKTRWGGFKSSHGQMLRPTKLVKSPRAGMFIPFMMMVFSYLFSAQDAKAIEKPEIVLFDDAINSNYNTSLEEAPLIVIMSNQGLRNNPLRHSEEVRCSNLSQNNSPSF